MPPPTAQTGRAEPPVVLPVFPLAGALLLPGNFMPLNIFEPRYRNMVEDALSEGGHIGMIQPVLAEADNLGLAEPVPELYSVGCAGELEQADLQDDGRYLILLRGVIRFRIETEIGPRRGYRQVRAGYEPFTGDLEADAGAVDAAPLLAEVERFGRRHELEFDMDLLASLTGPRLVNALAAALPFAPVEQQALLEAPTPGDRQQLLLELMQMEFGTRAGTQSLAPPTVN